MLKLSQKYKLSARGRLLIEPKTSAIRNLQNGFSHPLIEPIIRLFFSELFRPYTDFLTLFKS